MKSEKTDHFANYMNFSINSKIIESIEGIDNRISDLIVSCFGYSFVGIICREFIRAAPFAAVFHSTPFGVDLAVTAFAGALLSANKLKFSDQTRSSILNSIAIGFFLNVPIALSNKSISSFAWHLSLSCVNFGMSNRYAVKF